MAYAHDGTRRLPFARVRAGDGSFLFLSRPATDFADTGGVGPYEALTSPADLDRWALAATRTLVHSTSDDLDRARALRAAIWTIADALIGGTPLPGGAVHTVNAAAARPDLVPELSPAGVGWAPPAGVDAVLSWVARDAVAMAGSGDPARVRQCEGTRCLLLFYDDSRSGARRWCAPERCGDRTRSREYRRRQSGASDQGA